MVLFEAILLGVIQGFTEFLPVNSSAHLILMPWFFGWQGTLVDSLNFDVALHAGTLAAILAYFWRDWLELFLKFFTGLNDGTWRSGDGRFVWFIALATIPAGILGFKSQDKKPADGSIYYFVGIDDARFKRRVIPGDQLILKAEYVSDRRGLWKFNCSSYVGNELAASGTILCADRKV